MDMMLLLYLTHLEFQDSSPDLFELLVASCTTTTASVWPQLVCLSIASPGEVIGNSQMIPWIQTRPRLQSLTLHQDNQLTDTTCLPNLIHLDVEFTTRMTVAGIYRLVHRCPRLERIEFESFSFSTTSFPEAADGCLSWSKDENGYPFVARLDEKALNTIRLGPNNDGDDA